MTYEEARAKSLELNSGPDDGFIYITINRNKLAQHQEPEVPLVDEWDGLGDWLVVQRPSGVIVAE